MIYVLTKYGELRFSGYGETDQITQKKDIINTVSSAVAGKSNSYVSPLGTLLANETKTKQHSIKSHLTKGLRIL